jgi:hypothetical protein
MKRTFPVLLLIVVFVLAATGAFASGGLKVKVNVLMANVRQGANMSSAVLTQLPQGTVVDVMEKIGDWYRVSVTVAGSPAVGFLSKAVVDEVVEAAPPVQNPAPKPVQPAARPSAPPAQVVKTAPAAAPAYAPADSSTPKLFVTLGYMMGFGTDSQVSSATDTIYSETATYNLAYQLKKGNAIDLSVGRYFGPSWGIKLGGSYISRDYTETTTYSVPHPLWFGNPRTGDITGTGLKVTDIEIYLNLFYVFKLGPVDAELYGGPCYSLSSATIISAIAVTEIAYPYQAVSTEYTIPQTASTISGNTFGFDAGLNVSYRLASSFGLYLDARYVSASATYKPGGIFPDLPAALGGLRAGGGLKVMF